MMPCSLPLLLLALVAAPQEDERAFAPSSELGGPDALRPLDQGVGDMNPLSTSLRLVPLDLRVPTAFDRVYALDWRDDLLMRASGGLYAVFPQSSYAETAQGLVPEIPADTTFFIGFPGQAVLDAQRPMALARPTESIGAIPAPPDARPATARMDGGSSAPGANGGALRVDPRVLADPGTRRLAQPERERPVSEPRPTLADDPAYRSERMRRLVLRATERAARSGASSKDARREASSEDQSRSPRSR